VGEPIGEVLLLAIGIALSPVPVVAVILMLFTPRARSNGLSFLAGWAGGMLVVGCIVLLVSGVTDAATDDGAESALSGVVKLVLSVLLLLLAVRNWRSRPAGHETPELPKWMSALDGFTAFKAFGMGAVLSSVNPKNLVLLLAGVASISASSISGTQQVIVLVVLVVLASLSIVVPVGAYFALGDRAEATLTPTKDWLAHNNQTVMAVILVVFGAKLLGDGISILS
jgi:threonine/homoserine/homoserine lactone efflux protein